MQTHDYYWNYLPLLLQILVAVGFGAGIVTASWFIGKHRNTATKLATYECGIEAEGDARGRFSVRFYMVAMLFILFDVEAVFMLPWAVVYRDLPKLVGSRMFGFWEMVVYIGFVLVGLFTSGIREFSTGPPTRRTSNGRRQRERRCSPSPRRRITPSLPWWPPSPPASPTPASIAAN